ncbi:hypothetical protein GCM10020255_024090 [Rhodococcus baikonurensis]
MPNSVQPPTPSDSELADYDPDTCDAPDCENSLDDGEGYDGTAAPMPTNAKPQAHKARSQLSPAHHLGEGATYPTQHNETAQNFAALTNTQIDTQIETGRRKSMAFEVPKLTDRQQGSSATGSPSMCQVNG